MLGSHLATDPVRATYAITTVLALFALLLLHEARASAFLHFGPGTTPANTAKFVHMPIDTWKRWWLVVVLSTVYALLVAWRVNVPLSFKTQAVKARKVDYAAYCAELDAGRGRACEHTTARFALLDAVNQTLLSILPILLYSTHQLQFMVPSIVFGVAISTWGTIHFFRKKDGFPAAR